MAFDYLPLIIEIIAGVAAGGDQLCCDYLMKSVIFLEEFHFNLIDLVDEGSDALKEFAKNNSGLSTADLTNGLQNLVINTYVPLLNILINEVLLNAATAAEVPFSVIWETFYITKVYPDLGPIACVKNTFETLDKVVNLSKWSEQIVELTSP